MVSTQDRIVWLKSSNDIIMQSYIGNISLWISSNSWTDASELLKHSEEQLVGHEQMEECKNYQTENG